MSDGMLFVLHAPADDKYATALAAELDAVTVAQGASNLQFGANVLCIHVLSGWPARAPEGGLVCRLNNAAVPPGLRGINASGDAVADAAALRPMISVLQSEMIERAVRVRGNAPRLGKTAAAPAQKKPPLAARSVAGMAMTLAVAGVVGPMIMERAQATGTTTPPAPHPAAAAPVAPVQTAAASIDDAAPVESYIQISAEAESATPALDQYLTQEPAPTIERVVPAVAAPAVVHRVANIRVADVPSADTLPMSAELAPVLDSTAPVLAAARHQTLLTNLFGHGGPAPASVGQQDAATEDTGANAPI